MNNHDLNWREKFPPYVALILVMLLGFGLRVYRLDQQSLWWDEVYTVARSVMSVPELIQNLFESRVHLPLYFLLIQVWSDIGRSEFILRYFSVLCGVATIPLIYQSGRLLAGHRAGLLAAFLLTISPFHVWYSQEARMYTFLAFDALAANYFLLRLFRHESRLDWFGYTVTLTLTLYSHYLGVLILIAHYVFFSLHYRQDKERFKRWFICAFIAGAIFAAWFLAVFFISSFTQASISWIAPVHWYEPLLTLLAFSIGRTIDPSRPFFYLTFFTYLLFALTAVYYGSRRSANTAQRLSLHLLLAWLGVPLFLLTLVSLDWSIPQQRFVYMDRYIISLQPAFILLTAWGAILATRELHGRRWLLAVTAVALLVPTWLSLRNLYFEPAYAREDWRAAAAYMAANQQPGDVLLLNGGQVLPFLYYTEAHLPQVVLPSLLEYEKPEQKTQLEQVLEETISTVPAGTKRIWLVRPFDNAETHGFPQTRNMAVSSNEKNALESWMETNSHLAGRWYFTGIRLSVYDITNMTDSS
ncbi:MAG: glycosyltransferase family 39 protein [Ardenticatenaceae bacterium]|nr:glycosyltransferase family 39 protein [Ardenticatenaceae bacterium]